METLNVGQVVYVFNRDDHSIIPVQVFEEVVHRKISRVETSYYVRANSKPGAKIALLDLKKQKVFLSIDKARSFMVENATNAIDEICRDALESSSQFSMKEQIEEPALSTEITISHQPSNLTKIKLPNGEVVDVII